MASGVSGVGRSRCNAALPYSADPNLTSSGKLNLALNGDLDIGDVNLADMDPETIRVGLCCKFYRVKFPRRELKRLYTQIELYRTKAMRKENPHISRRRGGRKQRRFSLQPFHKRHHGSSTSPTGVPLLMHPEEVCCLIPGSSGYVLGKCHGNCHSTTVSICCPHHHHQHHHKQLPSYIEDYSPAESVEVKATSDVRCQESSGTVTTSPGAVGDNCRVCPSLVTPNDEEVSRVSEESTNSAVEETFLSATTTLPDSAGCELKQQKGFLSCIDW